MEAKKNGDIKTVQAFIDSINYSIFNDGLFIAAVKNGDLEITFHVVNEDKDTK